MPDPAPYREASKHRLGRQLAVLIVLVGVLLATSSEAEANLCELETGDSQLMSTVANVEGISAERLSPERVSPERFFKRTRVLDVASDPRVALECDALSIENCDINVPGGQPQPPNLQAPLRPNAALPQGQAQLLAPPRAKPLYAEVAHSPRPGHYPILYRPPRS